MSAMKINNLMFNVKCLMFNVRWLMVLGLSFIIYHLSFSSAAAQTMQEVFKSMPDSLMPYLSQNNRLDMIDFMESGMEAKVTNQLGGKSVMTAINDSYLSIRLNEATRCEMRLLPVSTPVDSLSQIICMVRTYGVEGKESEVTFYSGLWRPLELSVNDIWQQTFNHPQITLDDLTFRPDAMSQERYQEVRKILTPPLVCVELSPDDDFLTFTLSDVMVPPADRADVDVVKLSRKVNWSFIKLKK